MNLNIKTNPETNSYDIPHPKQKITININEQDPFTDVTFTELIQSQAKKKLPFILAIIRVNSKTHHSFDALNLRRCGHEKALTHTNVKTYKIFFFTINLSEKLNDSFKYLGHSKEKGDRKEFINIFFKAAEDNVKAMTNLALYYDNGICVKYSKKEAIKWWRLASAKGDQCAKDVLKNLYIKHQIPPRDLIARLYVVQQLQMCEECLID